MDKLDFLDAGHEPASDDVHLQSEGPTEEPATGEPSGGQPRDENGRFASANAEGESGPTSQPEPQPQPQASPQQNVNAPPPGYVPIAVVNALREEMRQLKGSLQPQEEPDIYTDPDAVINQRIQPVTQQITDLNMNWSRRFAEKEYGADAVSQAEQWALQQAQVDPMLGQRIISSDDPYGTAVAEWKKGQVLSKLSDPSRIDAFLAWEAAQKAAAQQPAVQQAAPAAGAPQNPMPTRSLATAPASGGVQHVPSGPGQAFDSLFTR